MKTIVLGDIHGLSIWKQVLDFEKEYDKVIFLGDYFDTYHPISGNQQIENFKEIFSLKQEHPDKFILLIGNHDYQYMKGVKVRCSGYNEIYADGYQEIIEEALSKRFLQISYLQDYFLFTHAGVTKTWLLNNNYDFHSSIVDFMNHLFIEKPESYRFTRGVNNSHIGDDVCQSPIWVRPNSLLQDKISNYIQFVGHTATKKLQYYDGVYFCDVFDTLIEYYVIEDDNIFPSGL